MLSFNRRPHFKRKAVDRRPTIIFQGDMFVFGVNLAKSAEYQRPPELELQTLAKYMCCVYVPVPKG